VFEKLFTATKMTISHYLDLFSAKSSIFVLYGGFQVHQTVGFKQSADSNRAEAIGNRVSESLRVQDQTEQQVEPAQMWNPRTTPERKSILYTFRRTFVLRNRRNKHAQRLEPQDTMAQRMQFTVLIQTMQHGM
jgi:hypothetical protein